MLRAVRDNREAPRVPVRSSRGVSRLRTTLGVRCRGGGDAERQREDRGFHAAAAGCEAANATNAPKSPLASSASQSMPHSVAGTCWRSAHPFAAR